MIPELRTAYNAHFKQENYEQMKKLVNEHSPDKFARMLLNSYDFSE